MRGGATQAGSAGGRDERLDFLRGLAMLAVIVNHVAIPSLFHVVSVEALGVVTGGEGFVFLSGGVVGFVSRRRLTRDGWPAAAAKLWRRALQIYAVALAANLIVYLCQFVPGLDWTSLTTYKDARSGTVYQLYGDHAPAPAFLIGILTLEYGPGQINILGLYVALMAVTPLLLLVLRRGWAPLALAASWCAYLLYQAHPVRILPCQSEHAFPFPAWQLLFVHGLAAGYHRDEILAAFGGRAMLRVVTVGAAISFCFFALNNPWHDVPGGARLRLIPEALYYSIYSRFFQRTPLGVGRFVNTLVLAGTLFMVLTRAWTASNRLLGWLCIPIGRATLYVFAIHMIFVVAVYNIPLLMQGRVGVNTGAHAAIILVIWMMVRERVFFRWIPR